MRVTYRFVYAKAVFKDYTLLLFGGLHPLCGIGVTSLIIVTSSPAADSARIAASRPEPGPLTNTSTDFSPCSIAAFVAASAAICAANGVAFLEPLNPSPPADAHEIAFPCTSVSVTIVLLKVDWI